MDEGRHRTPAGSALDPHLPFDLPLEVRAEDFDELGHVNNVVYLRWVQEAAIAHWNAAADEVEKASWVWVVTRHEIDYKRAALPGDALIARTWVGGAGRRAFRRHTAILRARDGRELAVACTTWCPLDVNTLRSVDVSEATRARFSTHAL